jgi:hypothetical protein
MASEKYTDISQVPEELKFDHYSEDLFDGTDRKVYPRTDEDGQAEEKSIAGHAVYVRDHPEEFVEDFEAGHPELDDIDK